MSERFTLPLVLCRVIRSVSGESLERRHRVFAWDMFLAASLLGMQHYVVDGDDASQRAVCINYRQPAQLLVAHGLHGAFDLIIRRARVNLTVDDFTDFDFRSALV